jgi:ABC-type oligopeptide transport system substrate-binding subunit/class 3 adenylate cyclase
MSDRVVAEPGASPPPAAPYREERRVVTALFADLAGPTALAEVVGPEDASVIVGESVSRIVMAIESFGGTVKDLAGDGVLALFGAPAAHEDDAERALRAALLVQHEIGSYAAEVAAGWDVQGFGVRVGVNTGPVVVGSVGAGHRVEYGAYGDTVNTAARLQASAAVGTILVGDATCRMAEPLFDWGPVASVRLKGKGEPTEVRTLVAARPGAARLRSLTGSHAPMVGRARELEQATQCLDAVRDGSGRILFVTGEAGIGKSRLVLELRAGAMATPAGQRPVTWLEGRCVSYGESLPYWPFRDLLRGWLGAGPEDPELRLRVALKRNLERLFGGRAGELYPYLAGILGLGLDGGAATRTSELSPEALQYRTFEVVGELIARLAEDGPLVVELEDLHWADPTSLRLTERLLAVTEDAAVLLVVGLRPEHAHASWRLREAAGRDYAHRTSEVALEALPGDAERQLLAALVGAGVVPAKVERRLLASAEGNPFYLEELVRTLADAGALVRHDDGWRFVGAATIEIPTTVQSVIMARIDRLEPGSRAVLTAASVLGRQFSLPLLASVVGGDGTVRDGLRALQRLDLVREGRRWPEPEYRFKHALIQETAYRSLLARDRLRLHRRAAEALELQHADNRDEVLGLLAHHWLAAEDEDRAIACLAGAGDKARLEYALDEAISHYRELVPLLEKRGKRQAVALVLFKLALALHTTMRFAEANQTYQRAFEFWTPPSPAAGPATETLRVATSFLPGGADPRSAIAWPNIQLCMQLFDRLVEAWPDRTIVPSLAERWEISGDGLRYVFHLRDGLRWSDGTPLTAGDVEFGIKRVLDPDRPGSSVAIYFVLENGQDYYLRRSADAGAIGVRALDDTTVEFRLAAPAPYFMSVMNRPDSGPQPRHQIERLGDAWVEPGQQVVSGPFRIAELAADRLVLGRRPDYARPRRGNVGRVELIRRTVREALDDGSFDVVTVRYTPRLADVLPADLDGATMGPAAWTAYPAFDHADPAAGNVEFRQALALGIDRDALDAIAPRNLTIARGGIVPPALQGHTPDIAVRFDPARARQALERSGVTGEIRLASLEDWQPIVSVLAETWQRVLGVPVRWTSWTAAEAATVAASQLAPITIAGWLPGYPDPEYYLRLLLHSESRTNEGGFAYPPYDALIEAARQERSDDARLEVFHRADRRAVVDRVALVPLVYGRSMAFVKPFVQGWWEFGKSSASLADLRVDRPQ